MSGGVLIYQGSACVVCPAPSPLGLALGKMGTRVVVEGKAGGKSLVE